ncbi:MAG: glycosyltransferase, partial [Cyclobacteriaceae bacterium]
MKEEVEREQCGVAVDPRNAWDFVRKITPFIHDPELLAAYQRNSRRLAEARYSRHELGKVFTGLFKKS